MRASRLLFVAFGVYALVMPCLPVPGGATPAANLSLVRDARNVAGQPIVPDAQVDRLIDPRFSPAERTLVRSALLVLPPAMRSRGVLYRTLDGKLHSNSLDLLATSLAKERAFGPGPIERRVVTAVPDERLPSIERMPSVANVCRKTNLGGFSAGEFRRVYTGCTGFSEESVTFRSDGTQNASTDCTIANAPNGDGDYVLTGAFSFAPTAAPIVESGLQYVEAGSASYFQGVLSFAGTTTYGSNVPCGAIYTVTMQLVPGNASYNDVLAGYGYETSSGEFGAGTPIIQQVPPAVFAANASNYIFFRQTLISQSRKNATSGEWFGLAQNAQGGPDRTKPEILYGPTILTPVAGGTASEFSSADAYAQRDPDDNSNVEGALCSVDSATGPGYFADDESLNLSNALASGTFPGTNCILGPS